MMNKDLLNVRFLTIALIIISLIILILIKIFSIYFSDSMFLQEEGKKRYLKYKDISSVRGTIYDRNNFPLAVSIVNYDLYALRGFDKSNLLKLSEVINISYQYIDDSFQKKTLLKKSLSTEELMLIKQMNLKNYEIESRQSRHYPLGDQISPLIGFYGTDGAQEGIEKSYDRILSGTNGKQKYYMNPHKEVISKPIVVKKVTQGQDIHLTIDSTIQFFAYKYLTEAIKLNKAQAGTAIVLDNASGHVLAMASYPSYNPNDPKRKIQKNRALVGSYELGSVLKPIVLSKALDNKILLIDEEIQTPRRFAVDDKIIVDKENFNKLTAKEVIVYSSQVGATKIALALGYEDLKNNYYNFGFTKPISINFPSASFGYMDVKENISDKELASLGYGYGISISPFQIATAYSVFANKGIKKDFKILKNDIEYSKQIISSESASQIMDSLNLVVQDGTGKLANIKGFSEGGKTGTAHQIKKGKGYLDDSYIASFAGIAPLTDQSLTIYVLIDGPGLNSYSGGSVAAPVFAKIAENSLNYLGYFEDE